MQDRDELSELLEKKLEARVREITNCENASDLAGHADIAIAWNLARIACSLEKLADAATSDDADEVDDVLAAAANVADYWGDGGSGRSEKDRVAPLMQSVSALRAKRGLVV